MGSDTVIGPGRLADHVTVTTPGGDRSFRDVYVEVVNAVLVVSRHGCPLAWFADRQWTEVSFL